MDRATHAVFDIAADLDTPVSAFLKLGRFSPRFLLESVEGGERLARYSFLGFGDSRTVWLTAGSVEASAAGLLRERRVVLLHDGPEEDRQALPRGLYAGTVGYFAHGGGMDQAIAIRTLVFTRGAYSFQAGAGIVADSVPEREHAEVLAKGAVLQMALRMAEEGL